MLGSEPDLHMHVKKRRGFLPPQRKGGVKLLIWTVLTRHNVTMPDAENGIGVFTLHLP